MVTVQLNDDLVRLMDPDAEPVDRRIEELVVLDLYRWAKISSGKAAEMLEMPRGEFIRLSGRHGIPIFDMTDAEWDAEQARIDAWVAGR